MAFLKNTWYLAAWAEEVSREMMARTLLGESVLMFRKLDGVAVAMGNRCPHRFAPLNQGKLVGDEVQCAYHGLKFDCSGSCTANPHGKHFIPPAMCVNTYPLVERHSGLWIWMGAAPPDEALIPDFAVLAQPLEYRTLRRYMKVEADYRLITDNLLDLTHIVFVHSAIGGAAFLENETSETQQTGQQIWCRRRNEAITAAPAYRAFQPAYVKVKDDKHQNIRWDPPSNLLLEIVHHETGKPDSLRTVSFGANILTPETESSTHYFWTVSRGYLLDNPALDQKMEQIVHDAFANEDKPIIEAQQRMMGAASFEDLHPVLIETDAACMRARRTLDRLIAAEVSPQVA